MCFAATGSHGRVRVQWTVPGDHHCEHWSSSKPFLEHHGGDQVEMDGKRPPLSVIPIPSVVSIKEEESMEKTQ